MWEEGVFSSLGNTWGQLSFWHGSHKSRWQCVASFSFLMRNFLCSEKIEVVKGEENVWRIVCCYREDVERPKGSSVSSFTFLTLFLLLLEVRTHTMELLRSSLVSLPYFFIFSSSFDVLMYSLSESTCHALFPTLWLEATTACLPSWRIKHNIPHSL